MTDAILIAHRGAQKMSFDDLRNLPVPEATRTHKPVPHHEIVSAVIETLGFRHINVVSQEFAATPDGMKCFGVLTLDHEFSGCRFAIGLRNANDKSFRLALTVGYRVMVCDNLAFKGDFTPLIAKHSSSFNLIDSLSVGIDRMQRNFEPLQRSVCDWRANILSENDAKLVIYEAFVEGKLAVSPKLMKSVHHHYFEPEIDEFKQATLWSLSNAFTSAFKTLDPIPQFKATAKLGAFLAKLPA